MRVEVLDIRSEGSATCCLVKASLFDYITSLPIDYQSYDIQRGIVSNIYLDSLIGTVLKRKHIPPIVLTVQGKADERSTFDIANFRILDGLQRTYRLVAIWQTIQFVKNEFEKGADLKELSRFQMSTLYSKQISYFNSTTKILYDIIQDLEANKNFDNIDSYYKDNYQWFEIWFNLTPAEEVNKMLILNAGHKPVKIKHQLELIFLSILPTLSKVEAERFKLIREREVNAAQFSKNRNRGEFLFSYLISALLSFREGQPVTTNSALILKTQNEDFNTKLDSVLLSFEFLNTFVDSLIEIESSLFAYYKEYGLRWIGREVVLSGIYGALGSYIDIKAISPKELEYAFEYSINLLITNIGRLEINDFESERNNLNLAKVNIGSANKNAVYRGILFILTNPMSEKLSWFKIFEGTANE